MSKEPIEVSAKIDKNVVDAVQEIVAKNPNRLESDPKEAISAFDRITKTLDATDKTDAAKLIEIRGIGNTTSDSGLKIFAHITANVIESDKITAPDKAAILDSLKDNFSFLGEDKYAESSRDETVTSILSAIHQVTLPLTGNADALSAINSGFKKNFLGLIEEAEATIKKKNAEEEEEEEKLVSEQKQKTLDERRASWNSVMELSPIPAKTATALTLALVVPPPLGLIMALGFIAYTWNMGNSQKEKPAALNDPRVQNYADAWKEFMPKQSPQLHQNIELLTPGVTHGELTEEDRKNTQQRPTYTGKAASALTSAASKDLGQDGGKLGNMASSLNRSHSGKQPITAEANDTKSVDGQLDLDKVIADSARVSAAKNLRNTSTSGRGGR